MSTNKKATDEAVMAAAEELVQAGKRPSIRNIAAKTGGSFSTISPVLKLWNQQERANVQPKGTSPLSSESILRDSMERMRQQVAVEYEARLEHLHQDLHFQRKNHDEDMEDAMDEIKQLTESAVNGQKEAQLAEHAFRELEMKLAVAEALTLEHKGRCVQLEELIQLASSKSIQLEEKLKHANAKVVQAEALSESVDEKLQQVQKKLEIAVCENSELRGTIRALTSRLMARRAKPVDSGCNEVLQPRPRKKRNFEASRTHGAARKRARKILQVRRWPKLDNESHSLIAQMNTEEAISALGGFADMSVTELREAFKSESHKKPK